MCGLLIAVSLCVLPAAPPDLPPDGGIRAHEPFARVQPGGYVAGSDGGVGWLGPWTPDPVYLVGPLPQAHPRRADHLLGMADSLTFPGVVSTGGSASSVALDPHLGAVVRRLEGPIGWPGTTTYIGLLVKPEGRLHAGAVEGCFNLILDWRWPGDHDRGTSRSAGAPAMGKPWAGYHRSRTREWCLHPLEHNEAVVQALGRRVHPTIGARNLPPRFGGGRGVRGSQVSTGVVVVPGATTFLVMRLEAAPNGRSVLSMLVNPDPTGPEPPPGAAVMSGLSAGPNIRGEIPSAWLTLVSSGAVTFDELRVADSLAGAAGIVRPMADD